MRITRITGGLKLGYIFIEVIVVTIGILIALQIDNWKESRNRKEQELKTLRELKTALQEDLRILALMQARYDEGISSSDVILRHLHKGGRYHDSLQTHMQKVAYGFQFQQRTSAYEN